MQAQWLRYPLAVALLCLPLAAQWINYPSPGIPRTADGKPILPAPAPKGPDGKPDLTGVWRRRNDKHWSNLATGVEHVPFQPWAEAAFRKANRKPDEWEDGLTCMPRGFPRQAIAGNHPFRILQAPTMTLMLMEEFTQYRQVFTDGRPLPENREPTRFGYSTGRWDGNTFVVETVGISEKVVLDNVDHPHTDALHLTERYRRTDVGHLEMELTIDDAKAYTEPWKTNIGFDLFPDTEVMEHTCENERSAPHMPGR